MQGALVASMFRAELLKRLDATQIPGTAEPGVSTYGMLIPPGQVSPPDPDEPWIPVEPSLDLARDRILPPAPKSFEPDKQADSIALVASRGLTPILRNAVRKTLSGIRVMDYQGIVVASTLSDMGRSLVGQEEVRQALQGEHMSVLRRRVGKSPTPPLESISRGSRVRVFVAMPVIEGNRVLGAVLLSRTPPGSHQGDLSHEVLPSGWICRHFAAHGYGDGIDGFAGHQTGQGTDSSGPAGCSRGTRGCYGASEASGHQGSSAVVPGAR